MAQQPRSDAERHARVERISVVQGATCRAKTSRRHRRRLLDEAARSEWQELWPSGPQTCGTLNSLYKLELFKIFMVLLDISLLLQVPMLLTSLLVSSYSHPAIIDHLDTLATKLIYAGASDGVQESSKKLCKNYTKLVLVLFVVNMLL